MQTVAVLCNDEIQEDRPVPSRNHARVAQKLGVLFNRFAEHVDVFQQLSLDLNGWETIPDISVYKTGEVPYDFLTDEEKVTIPPTLIIEILSPKQNLQPLVEKVTKLLENGVGTAWIVLPMSCSILIHRRGMSPRAVSEGTLRDEATGVEIDVATVFAKP